MVNAGFKPSKIKQTVDAVKLGQKYDNYKTALANGSPADIATSQQQLQQAYNKTIADGHVGPAQSHLQETQLAQHMDQLSAAQEASTLLANASTNASGQMPDWQSLGTGGMSGDTVTVVSSPDVPLDDVDVVSPDLVLTGARQARPRARAPQACRALASRWPPANRSLRLLPITTREIRSS